MDTRVDLARQILTIQKTMVRNGFTAQVLWQEQGERTARAFCRPAGAWSPESERLWHNATALLKAGRDAAQALVDAQFALVESLLEQQTSKAGR